MSDTENSLKESLDEVSSIKLGPKKKKKLPTELKKTVWKPGQSGNPNGRPKGSKNKLTILREAVLQKAETMVLNEWEDLVRTTIALAKQGDSTCIKILWDRVIPAKRAVEEKDGKEDKLNINITVQGMEVKSVFGDRTEVIEADYEEVEKENGS